MEISDMKEINDTLYADIVGKAYGKSYANPTHASEKLGEELGVLLGCLYAEFRAGIPYAFEEPNGLSDDFK